MPVTYGGFAISHGQTLGTVTFGTSTFFTLQILQLDWPGMGAREQIEVTNMNVQPCASDSAPNFGNRMFIPSAYCDPGVLKLSVNHDPTQNIPLADWNDIGAEQITIMLGPSNSSQQTFTCLGWLMKYDIVGPLDGKACTANVEIRLTDDLRAGYSSSGAVQMSVAA